MEYTKTLLKKFSTIKEEIPKSFTYSASLKVIHCPYCAHQALYGIIIDKHREIIIRYRCSKGHQGEMNLFEFLWRNEKNNIYEMKCKYCDKKKNNSIYCEQCEGIFCSKEPCLSKHENEKHNKIESLLDFDSMCYKHNKIFEFFCEFCDVALCEDCPLNHIEHTVTCINKINEEKIDEINNILEFNEEKLDNIYDQKLKYKQLKEKIDVFEKIQKAQIHYIKNLLYSLKTCNRISPELFLNIIRLKINKIIIKEDTLIEDIIESYNLIEPYSIKFKQLNSTKKEGEEKEKEEEKENKKENKKEEKDKESK